MTKEIEKLLNNQVKYEATASMQYLAMASWAENKGFSGIADFFYAQSAEESQHMIKLIRFINEREAVAVIPSLEGPEVSFEGLRQVFETFLENEKFVTNKINEIIFECLERKDYNVHNFMQWYVAEQLEEEATARALLDKLKIIGEDPTGHYIFDRDIMNLIPVKENGTGD